MACARGKIDHTANLPDELLHQVFSYLPLPDKLRVESVSRRFQRCVVELMKLRPQPLRLNTQFEFLNGCPIRSGQVYDALRSLVGKAKFTNIKIEIQRTAFQAEQKGHINTLLLILSESDCLDKVVSFECNYGPSQDILEKVIAKCAKLSTVRFDFVVRPPNIQLLTPGGSLALHSVELQTPPFVPSTAMDLNPVLNAKALTQLELRLTAYPQERLVELFHSIKPQTLQKLSLSFYGQMPTLDLTALVQELHTNAWAALQLMILRWETSAVVHLAPFIQSLSLLPALETCHINLDNQDIQPKNQFVAAMTALFKSEVKINLSSAFLCHDNMPDCQVMAQIRQLQKVDPSVDVDFQVNNDDETYSLTLSSDNALFEERGYSQSSCGDVHCVDCHRFFPSVLSALEDVADDCQDIHLDRYQLDKCKIDTVVEGLNHGRAEGLEFDGAEWRALSAETNDAGDLVTIGFETIEHDEDDLARYEDVLPQYFEITVACGPCFSSSCIQCVNVD